MANQLSNYNFLQLVGLQYAAESLKSVFLTLATVSSHLNVDKAVELALLEQKYQSDIWGKVNFKFQFSYHFFCLKNVLDMLWFFC